MTTTVLHRCIYRRRHVTAGIVDWTQTLCGRKVDSADIEARLENNFPSRHMKWRAVDPRTPLEWATCEGCRSYADLYVDWTPVIARTIFASTLSASMLRSLAIEREMQQREFMRQYHARSTRKTKSKSAFRNNMGRFVIDASIYSGKGGPCRVIERTSRDVARAGGGGTMSVSVLSWKAPDIAAIVRSLSNAGLDTAFASLECQVLAPRPNEPEHHLMTWLGYVRREIVVRAERHKDKATIVSLVRTIAAREFGEPAAFPFFSANYNPGESPDDAIARLFVEERKHHATDEECVLVMCHG